MRRQYESLKRDKAHQQPRISDIPPTIADLLREARQRKELSQKELASKLGLRQRQISDLERATTDPRLSTIQNVARALELELTLVPRHLISTVEALQRAGSDVGKRPLYALRDEEMEHPSDEPPHLEVGDSGEFSGSTRHQSRSRKEP